MIVTCDGQRVDADVTVTDTLQCVVDRVRAAQPADRLIINVRLNGQPLDKEALDAALDQPVPGDAQVDVESADRLTLCRDVLRELAAEFGASAERLGPIADALAAGEGSAAVAQLGEFIGMWQTCYQGMAECSALLGRDLTQGESAGRSVAQALANVVEKLTTVREALEVRDLVLLADLVRYELPPLVHDWQALLGGLAEQVR